MLGYFVGDLALKVDHFEEETPEEEEESPIKVNLKVRLPKVAYDMQQPGVALPD